MTKREILSRAIRQRLTAQRLMATKRRDHAAVFVAIGKAQAVLKNYPVASDDRVRQWCLSNRQHINRICIGGTSTINKLIA